MILPMPLDLDALLVAVDEFYAARGASRDAAALKAAERVCAVLRSSLKPDAIVGAKITVTRSLWRLAKTGELTLYMERNLTRDLADRIFKRPDLMSTVKRADLDADNQPTTVPKRMVLHTADLRFLAIPIKEKS